NLAEFFKFISSMLIAWSLNFITLKICLKFGVNPYISQIIAGAIYTITGYLLSKIWVFKKQT
ncbi:MAG: GtrA family protein, partial [Campylobacter sp.]|nr:GtrA family protein [Campylobacter sp.]